MPPIDPTSESPLAAALPESDAPPILPPDVGSADLPAASLITKDTDDAPVQDDETHQKAFDGIHRWQGTELLAYSFGRESLFYQLRAAVGAPDIDTVLIDQDAFLADAARILWLCSHSPAAFRHLRGTPALMQEAVEAWADIHIPRGTRQLASLTAMQVFEEGAVNIAIPSDPPGESGN
jgi:hypothetical protein